jgi:hypothetical protein
MTTDALQRFHDDESSGYDELPWPYKEVVGELGWIVQTCCPNITFAHSVLAHFAAKPKEVHWVTAKRVARYLKGMCDLGLVYHHVRIVELLH